MDKNRIKGKSLQTEGKIKQAAGKMQEGYGKLKDEARAEKQRREEHDRL